MSNTGQRTYEQTRSKTATGSMFQPCVEGSRRRTAGLRVGSAGEDEVAQEEKEEADEGDEDVEVEYECDDGGRTLTVAVASLAGSASDCVRGRFDCLLAAPLERRLPLDVGMAEQNAYGCGSTAEMFSQLLL